MSETLDTVMKFSANPDNNAYPEAKSETIHYRVVQDDEMAILHPLFERLGWPDPEPAMAKVVVAEAGTGKQAIILGFCVVQFIVHSEPMWVHPSARGTGIAEGIVQQVMHYIEHDCKIKRYVCIAKTGSFAARLCEQYGYQPWPGQVFVRQLE